MSEAVDWRDDGTPRSPRFDDIYRTATGGLEQAQHVFLQGTGLPQAWAGQPQWRVLETGFGLGLNFLATWHAWRSDPQRPALLHFASVEAWPVAAADLLRAVATYPALQPLAEELAAQWAGLVPGFHRFVFEGGRVLLTLCVGDVAPMLKEQEFRADAVFLDGFEPLHNPQMWSLDTLKGVTRLCRRGTRIATWTVNGQVRRDLRSCGWQVDKRAGLPPKRECLAGRYDPSWPVKGLDDEAPRAAADAIVLGAGLSGAAVAASLARRGWSVRVLDAASAPASGASALPAGLLAPHQSPDDNLLSRLSRAGVRVTLQQAQQRLARGLEWERTGVLEWCGDDARALPALGESLAPWTREATPAQKDTAGVDATENAWWHENAAWIEPAALVRSWLRETGVRFEGGKRVARIVPLGDRWGVEDASGTRIAEAGLVVVAAALASADLLPAPPVLNAVRGQVTWGPHGEDAGTLPPFPVNGHGHFLPRVPLVDRGAWITGSTYGRGDTDTRLRPQDDDENLRRVAEVLPAAAEVMQAAAARGQVRSWAGVRCTSADRRPLVGEISAGLWLATAMGSRGLTFAALCGELLAARLHGEPLPLEARLARALDLSRLGPPRSG
ncbi:FAD-dependent 5-carboxymethylaminomethyl-2-thiouridine(34) oxidoreductase MnmC [Ramlibacter sp. USB13]|uniref:tRNA 5-methylaminomethyl-2-thiouridine biosynthesis bifunctional protein MnmC n=1 Tax=Ramlibacter cellulosilyticus TaxID=2764187 RepID=A0A923MPI6_9BURK|nr:FAD-dependent 5-carboxymethylaminomethyl-2-thiouridine(34) oxidoreductase MnmC [Ramlibacter cellulosilyticus]MBC5783452.1 FAD-dependent 5-carboxymethylaminomethyl-2-thiouridine(34) oxidoreductase MnmC [Ramlibacter cellulosilyticus]